MGDRAIGVVVFRGEVNIAAPCDELPSLRVLLKDLVEPGFVLPDVFRGFFCSAIICCVPRLVFTYLRFFLIDL